MSQQINLLASAPGKKQFSFLSAKAMALGVGLAVVLALVVANYEDSRARIVERQARGVADALKDATATYEKATGTKVVLKPNAELEARIAEFAAQLKARQDVIDALKGGVVGTTRGFSEYMRVFSRQSLDGLWLTGFDIAAGGNDLTLAGRALRADLVPVYLQRLNREGPMQGRQFASMLITQPRPALQAGKDAQNTQQGRTMGGAGDVPPYVEFTVSSTDPAAQGAKPEGAK